MFRAALLLVMAAVTVNGLSSGAPFQACETVTPQHGGFSPSASRLLYLVNTSAFVGQTYIPNQLYTNK